MLKGARPVLDWKKLLAASAPSIADLDRAEAALREESSMAETEVGELQAARRGILLNGTEADIVKHDERIASAARRQERALAAVEEVSARLTQARDSKSAAERQARYDAAARQVEAAREALRRDYPEAKRMILGLLRALAEAEIARIAANADRPPDAAVIPSAEDFRGAIYEPAREASRVPVILWVDQRTGNQLPDNMQHTLNENRGDTKKLPQPFAGVPVAQAAFDRITRLDARHLPALPPLASGIALPALEHWRFDGFVAIDTVTAIHPHHGPSAVLQALDQVEQVAGCSHYQGQSSTIEYVRACA